jgi:hypothetical protein
MLIYNYMIGIILLVILWIISPWLVVLLAISYVSLFFWVHLTD